MWNFAKNLIPQSINSITLQLHIVNYSVLGKQGLPYLCPPTHRRDAHMNFFPKIFSYIPIKILATRATHTIIYLQAILHEFQSMTFWSIKAKSMTFCKILVF